MNEATAKGITRGLLEKGGPRVHAALALICGLTSCGVLILLAIARVKEIPVQAEYLATLSVFSALTCYLWKVGKTLEEGSNDAPAPPTAPGVQP